MNQKQWLNIVIIVISALILMFMLIGRFMNRAVEEAEHQTTQNEELLPVEKKQPNEKSEKHNPNNDQEKDG